MTQEQPDHPMEFEVPEKSYIDGIQGVFEFGARNIFKTSGSICMAIHGMHMCMSDMDGFQDDCKQE